MEGNDSEYFDVLIFECEGRALRRLSLHRRALKMNAASCAPAREREGYAAAYVVVTYQFQMSVRVLFDVG